MAAFAKRPSRKLLLAFLSVLLVAGGLVFALPDTTPAADAHPPWTEPYTYNVTIGKTREVPVYEWVTEKVRVQPFWEKYTQRFPCETVIIGGEVGTYCPPPKTSWRQVYNYKTVSKKVQTGTKTEVYFVTETRTGTRTVHDPHYEPPPTPTPEPPPKPTADPTPKPCAEHTHNGLASHCTTQDHTTAEPACTSSNGGQTVTWITAHYNQQSKTCPAVQTECVKPSNGHRHDSTNTCHGDHDAEPVCGNSNAGQTVTWTTHTGTDSHNHQTKTCPAKPDNVECPTGYQYGSGLNGGHPPYAAPAGKFWTSATATKPDVPPHSCWQLRSGSCPTGQTMAHAVYSGTPNRVLIGYADLSPEPDGKRWNRESANADYACYKLVQEERTSIGSWFQPIADWFHQEIEDYGDMKVREMEGYIALGQVLHVGACLDETQLAAALGNAENARRRAKQIKTVRDLANAAKASPLGAAGAVGIYTLCKFGPDPKLPDSASADQARSSSAKDSASVPASVSSLGLVAGDGEIAVSWTASATTTNARSGYRVQWKLTSETWDQTVRQYKDFAHGSAFIVSWAGISGLSNGSAYDVRVAAYNAVGFSEWVTATATPAKLKAPAPASGLALSAGDKQIAVSWTASATTPAAGFGYWVQWKPAAEAWGETAVQFVDLEHGSDLATSHTVAGLVNGSAYDVRVAAYNAGGLSDWITGQAAPAAPAYKAPASLVATVRGYAAETHHGQDHVDRWNGALEGLCVEDFPGISAMTSAQAQGHADAYSSSRWSPVVAELKKAEAANCTIAVKPEPKASAPDPASGLSLSAGDKQIAISWSASATAPAAGFGYRVQWKLVTQAWGDAAVGSEDLDHGSDLATSHTITGLVNGSAYDVRVAAFNAHGVSDWVTSQATPAAAASAPDPASGLSLSAGDKQIAVSWSASATAPAAGFGYRVQWKLTTQAWGDAAVQSTDLAHGSNLATSHTITGLVNGSAYDVRVAAFNTHGVSDWITGQTTPAKPKPKPSLAFDSVSCESSGSGWVISVTWSKTPETLKPDIWANEAKNRGHRGLQKAVAGTSTTFDVPNAGWYQVGMQAKIAGNKKVGDNEAVRCR